MNFDQFANLIRAGYSEAQITQINRIMGESAPAPAQAKPEPEPSPAPAPDTNTNTPEPTPAPAADPAPAESETQKMLKEMLGLMQRGFVNTLQNPTPKEDSAEEILAKVLNP